MENGKTFLCAHCIEEGSEHCLASNRLMRAMAGGDLEKLNTEFKKVRNELGSGKFADCPGRDELLESLEQALQSGDSTRVE